VKTEVISPPRAVNALPVAMLLAVPCGVNQEYRSASAGSCAKEEAEKRTKEKSRNLDFMEISLGLPDMKTKPMGGF
jgi:hypothetical protein